MWAPPHRRSALQRPLQPLEHPHHAQAGVAVGAGGRSGADALDEVLALHAQGLDVGDLGEKISPERAMYSPQERVSWSKPLS